jgi:hypothetical protein
MRTDGQRDFTKPTVAFRNFAKAPADGRLIKQSVSYFAINLSTLDTERFFHTCYKYMTICCVLKRHIRLLSTDATKPFQDHQHLPCTECIIGLRFVLQAQNTNAVSNWFSYKVMLDSALSLKLIIDHTSVVAIITY